MTKRVYQEFIEWGEIPSSFKCPLSRILMLEPVIDEDGHSYEKTAIECWLNENDNISPITGRHLDRTRIIINRALKNAIEEYTEDVKHYNNAGLKSANAFNLIFKVMENAVTKYKISNEIANSLSRETLGCRELAVLDDVFKNVKTDDELGWFPKTREPFLFKSAVDQCRWVLYPHFRRRIYAEFSQYLRPYASYKDLEILSPLSAMQKADAEKAYLESLIMPNLNGTYVKLQDAMKLYSKLYPLAYKVDPHREKTLIDEQIERWIEDDEGAGGGRMCTFYSHRYHLE
jgi:hypothetical protein